MGSREEIRIVIVDRGFIFAGPIKRAADGAITIERGVCVRRWGGDSKGIGYTAKHGPTGRDAVDGMPCGVEVPAISVIAVVGCDQDAWSRTIKTACDEIEQ